MNRLREILKEKDKNILSVYFTAGFPKLNDTAEILQELDKHGVDIVEIGFPFSDPIADGVVIQQSSTQALRNGMNMDIMFEQLSQVSGKIKMALVLMAYLNNLMAYGIENVFKKCKECKISAIIIPDLPLEEYKKDFKKLSEKYNVDIPMLISPQSDNNRIIDIDNNTNPFIYMVSTSSVTGIKEDFDDAQVAYFDRINAMNLNNKLLIGFGISNNKTLQKAFKHSCGAIIGSAFIKCLKSESTIKGAVEKFISDIHK